MEANEWKTHKINVFINIFIISAFLGNRNMCYIGIKNRNRSPQSSSFNDLM